MTRISGFGANPPDQRASFATEEQRRDTFSGDRTGDRNAGPGREAPFGQSGLGAQLGNEHERAFAEKMRTALGDGVQSAEAEDGPRGRLLAVAGGIPLPWPVLGMPAEAFTAAPTAGRAGWVGALVERIEQALQAQFSDALRSGVGLRLDLTGMGGPGSVTITLAPQALDVVFAHGGGAPSAELAAIAQSLADRLQARFPDRVVRIRESTDGPEERPSGGIEEVSRLLGRQGGR